METSPFCGFNFRLLYWVRAAYSMLFGKNDGYAGFYLDLQASSL